MTAPRITLAYSTHRPETLPTAEALMAKHAVVFLEELRLQELAPMLSGEMAIEDYLLLQEVEYPDFGRLSCRMLRRLHRQGVIIRQGDPFMDILLEIHDRFAEGQGPADLPPATPMMDVYSAERSATAALLNYYEAAPAAAFEEVIRALTAFARADAARFRLRDRMRASFLIGAMPDLPVYVEAGSMHLWLRRELKRRNTGRRAIHTHHLMAPAVRAISGRVYLMAPGDRLTATYLFTPRADNHRTRLLAAQSLIYNKIVTKVEHTASAGDLPHTHDEWQAIQLSLIHI